MNNSINDRYKSWLPKSKTVFPLNKRVLTSFNLGQLTPLGFFEGLPGDTFNVSTDAIIRFTSPLVKPAFEKFEVHMTAFAVPLRLLLKSWKKVMGERDNYEKEDDKLFNVPTIEFVDINGQPINNSAKSILAYLGVPIPTAEDIKAGKILRNVNKLLSNAYALVWNEHFRDQNLQQAKEIDISDSNIYAIAEENSSFNFHSSAPNFYTGGLANVNRNFDYFSNTFTDTQKGEEQVISLAGRAPIVTGTQNYDLSPNAPAMTFNDITTGSAFIPLGGTDRQLFRLGIAPSAAGAAYASGLAVDGTPSDNSGVSVQALAPRNLYADLSSSSSISINDFREIEKLQRRRELDLAAGTRLYETIENYFGIKADFARLDYPQQISYSKGELHISQVVQTSAQEQGTTTAQGNVAGYGVDTGGYSNINITLQEHSVIIPFMYITQRHTYQQGLDKFFNRRNKTDWFDPFQIGLGFQPIYKSEIYGHLSEAEKNDVWGYAPQGERYRKSTDIVTGMLNGAGKNNIAQWHAGDLYNGAPTLTGEWKLETPKFLDNILVYPSKVVDNFIVEANFDGIKISVVDPLGIPTI